MLGIDISEFAGADRGDAIGVSIRGSGVDPFSVTLVVSFAPMLNVVFISPWKNVLFPRIRNKYGQDAVGPEKLPEDESS